MARHTAKPHKIRKVGILVIQIEICCLLLTFLYTSLTHIIQEMTSLKRIEKEPDIIVNSSAVEYFKNKINDIIGAYFIMPAIDNLTVDQFITNNAIKEYHTYYLNYKYYADWNGIESSPIFKNTEDLASQVGLGYDWNNELKAFLPVYSQYDEEYYNFLENHIDEGEWNREDFEKGNIIYIYIPKYTEEIIPDETNLEQYYWDSNPDTFYDKAYIFQDTTLNVGDTIVLQEKDEPAKKCKVGGIIRDYYSFEETSIPNNIYQIFVSSGFYNDSNPVNTISLYFNVDENSEMLESHYSTLASKNNMIFLNQSQEKRRQREIVQNDILLYGVICVGILLVLIFTQVLFASQKCKETKYQFDVFNQLGISSLSIKRIQQWDLIIKVPMILFVSFGVFVLIQYMEYLPTQRLMNPFTNRFTSEYWSWWIFIWINLSFILIYVICSHNIYTQRRKSHGTDY